MKLTQFLVISLLRVARLELLVFSQIFAAFGFPVTKSLRNSSLNCLALSRQASAFVFSAGVRGVLHLSSISFLHASKDVLMPDTVPFPTFSFSQLVFDHLSI